MWPVLRGPPWWSSAWRWRCSSRWPSPPAGTHAGQAEWLSAVLVFGGSTVVLAALGTRGSPVRRAVVLAMAAALTWALMATFLKTVTETLTTFGISGVLTRWPVYALPWPPSPARCSSRPLCTWGR